MFRNCIIISSLLASGLQASILNGGFENGNLTDYSVDVSSNVTTTPAVFTPSAYQLSDPPWFLAFPTAPEGNFYALLSNGPGDVNPGGPTDVSILDTIAYFVNSPAATFGFTYDFLSGDNQGDFFQVNVLHGGVATQLLLVPDSDSYQQYCDRRVCFSTRRHSDGYRRLWAHRTHDVHHGRKCSRRV